MKYVAAGLLAFTLFCAARAPAGLFALLIERVGGASLAAAAGTVWSGRGALRFRDNALGQLQWSFEPASLAQLAPGYAWQLTGNGLDLHGGLAFRTDGVRLSAQGAVAAEAVNAELATYGIRLDGRLDIESLDATLTGAGLARLEGGGRWSGGAVSYPLGGRSHTALLPPMRAEAQSAPITAKAFAEESGTLLMQAEIIADGYAKIGVTRRLLQLLNQPWAGRGADDEIVISLEEAVF